MYIFYYKSSWKLSSYRKGRGWSELDSHHPKKYWCIHHYYKCKWFFFLPKSGAHNILIESIIEKKWLIILH